ncbi:MAG: S8 family peptidase [Polaribacter sp.]|jgi:thermitase|nr:S8 family peptidase [Polaribacter sp.]MDG1954612.1 S8 family peptidase [Polaribacter sp.]
MKKVLLVAICSLSFTIASAQEFAKRRLIVKYKTTTSNAKNSVDKILSENHFKASKSLSAFKGTLQKSKNKNSTLLFTFKEGVNLLKVIDELKKTGVFEYVEPDFIGHGGGKKGVSNLETSPSDQYLSRQWGLVNNGTFSLSNSTSDADVDMDLAWDITTGNSNIILAVLDSGIKMNHPEFAGRIWVNPNETNNNSDSDANNYTDDINGWDFVNNDNNPTDDHGHGTNVAGISAATGNNSIGYAGVDWKCKIMPLKILDNNNSGFYSWWIAAINYAVSNGAKVINMSVGGSGFSQGMKDAVDNAHANGVVITVSMMNFNNNTSYYPAAYSSTIAVGSTNSDDKRTNPFFWNPTSGSNYGNHIDVIAPGNYIYGLSYNSDTNYNSYWGGTSQAAPLVAGICSLLLDQNPNLTVEQIRTILKESAEDQVGNLSEDTVGWDQYYGSGRVNAFNALQKVLSVDSFDVSKFSVYPNPTSNNLFISNILNNSSFKVFDTLGKEVFNGKIIEGKIQLSTLKPGIYILKIKKNSGNIIKRVIKT